jgi:hypothetical protein
LDTVKLIIGNQNYTTGQSPNLDLVGLKPSTGAPALLITLEVADSILFQKILGAAEQRSLKVQVRGKELTTELATRSSSLAPAFRGRIVLRQCSPMRDVR